MIKLQCVRPNNKHEKHSREKLLLPHYIPTEMRWKLSVYVTLKKSV